MEKCLLILGLIWTVFLIIIILLKLFKINNKYIILLLFCISYLCSIVNVKIMFNEYFNRHNNITDKDVNVVINNIDKLKKEVSLLNAELDEVKNQISEQDEMDLSKLDDKREELDLLNMDLDNKTKEYNNQVSEYKNLTNIYNRLIEQTKYQISDFPTYHQFPNYPNGCEEVSLYLMLKYQGVNLTVEDVVKKLRMGSGPHTKNGKRYGADPEYEFVGDPRKKSGYGVFQKPVLDVANQFKPGMKDITGSSLNSVLKIVGKGIPVQVWASINLRNTYSCGSWESDTEESKGKTITWNCGLHSLVVVGYTYDKVITSDPYVGKIVSYDRAQFKKMYNIYGKRAIYYEK